MSERHAEEDAPWYIGHHNKTGHDTVSRYGEPQRCLTCGAEEPT